MVTHLFTWQLIVATLKWSSSFCFSKPLIITISSVGTITFLLDAHVRVELDGSLDEWVGVAGSYCLGSICQYYAC
jgi:hypothetical protein